MLSPGLARRTFVWSSRIVRNLFLFVSFRNQRYHIASIVSGYQLTIAIVIGATATAVWRMTVADGIGIFRSHRYTIKHFASRTSRLLKILSEMWKVLLVSL